MFVIEKVLKRRQQVGAAAHRGGAAEDGVMHGLLHDAPDSDCIMVANASFNKKAALCGDPRRDREAEAIPEMVKIGLAELRAYGRPTSVQGRVDHKVDGLAVPIMGYYDAEWADHGILIDLKTTHRIPSEISTSHARQVALYKACRGDNVDARLTYVSTKKAVTYRLENAREHLLAIERIAMTIQKFLSLSADPAELVAITTPDVDSFYFSDPAARRAAFEIYGF